MIKRIEVEPQEVLDEELLRSVLTSEALRRMRIPPDTWRAEWVKRLGKRATPNLYQRLYELEEQIERFGICDAINQFLPRLQQTTVVENQHHVPETGPALIVTNHPGGGDFSHLMGALPRNDPRIVAGTSMLNMLPNGRQFFIYSTEAVKRPMGETTRLLVEQLKLGHCVIIFARGTIEPDPKWQAGARMTVEKWRRSFVRIANEVPSAAVIPTVISGALSRKALDHWAVRYYRNQLLRARGAAIIQTASQFIGAGKWPVETKVTFGRPILDHTDLFKKVTDEVNQILTLVRHHDWPLTPKVGGWV